MTAEERCLAVIGLGYVGLPVAVAFAKKFPGTIGFDVDARRVESLAQGIDWTHEVDGRLLRESGLKVTMQLGDLNAASVFVVCVPTAIYGGHRPDLRPLQSALEMVGKCLRKGGVVVYWTYGTILRSILARVSGLRQGVDFKLGYSPERINPGDKEHIFENIKKVVAAEDEPTAQLLADIYGTVVHAGVHVATSIKVAEAAKVLENFSRRCSMLRDRCGVMDAPARGADSFQ